MCDNSEELWWQWTSNWACDKESVYLLLCFELWYVTVLTMDWCILNVAIDSIYVLKTDIFNQSFVFLLLQDLQFDISQAKRYFSSFSKIVIHVYTGMFIHVYVGKKNQVKLELFLENRYPTYISFWILQPVALKLILS